MLRAFHSGSNTSNSTNSATPPLCAKCQSQPQARNPSTGRYYIYCSNACAGRMLPGLPVGFNVGNSQGTGGDANATQNPFLSPCDHCKKKPRHIEGTTVHPYCGKNCANLAKGKGLVAGSRSSAFQNTSTRICKIQECSSPVWVDPSGVASDYCTRTHLWRQRGCISCRKAPTDGVTIFCESCHVKFLHVAPTIVEVPEDHVRYESVASQFRRKWLHDTECPEVRAVYKIVNTTKNFMKYEQYRDRAESKHQCVSQGRAYGNENRRWHGTIRKCNIGDEGVTTFCSNPSCSLCRIMKTSFDLSISAKSTNFKRFGVGIYTSSTSSKTDQYSRNGCTSPWKAMLLNRVVVGCGYKLTADNTTLTKPPTGFDSILGEVGDVLNYDETVVYDNDAIRPSYLVMYNEP